ncbi:UNVERIFIED_ORG: hypothetical protein GGR78_003290 [Xanthomonas campestris]
MKEISKFKSFLADTVNLNNTRIDLLDSSFETIKRFIRNADYKPKIISFYKHGSWAHKTIIKPIEGNAFDADVIVFIQPIEDWTAADYVNELARVFRDSATYKDKLRVYSHCVTIEYAGVRKMDITPCVCGRINEDEREVCNRTSNSYQRSEPAKYTDWLRDRNLIVGGNQLRKVTRLLKYLRDIKTNFSCPSFLLTTLLGIQINDEDRDTADFSDIPTALQTVVARLDNWLQARPSVPAVSNPVLPEENQASSWSETQYDNFRSKISVYRAWIDQAYVELDAEESLKKWRKVFGDDFGTAPVRKAVATAESRELALDSAPDEVDIVRSRGLHALEPSILWPSWRRPAIWIKDAIAAKVTVLAKIGNDRGGVMLLRSYMILEPNQPIYFYSMLGGVTPPTGCTTHWRVTNTGSAATADGALRGGFDASDSPHMRREWLMYRGVHMVEAFIVRNEDMRLVGFSDPFYVTID